MAKAAMKAQLDALFGELRDGDDGNKKRFDDADVCRNYLLDFCINDILLNAKRTAPCARVHSRQLQMDYQAACKKEGHDFGYPYDLKLELRRLVDDCERDIQRGAERCAAEAGENGQPGLSEDSKEVRDLVDQIKELQKQAEVLGSQGSVDEAAAMLSLVKDLENKKVELTGRKAGPVVHVPAGVALFPRTGNKENDEAAEYLEKDPVASGLALAFRQYPNQKLRVCEVCAAFLSSKDNAKRVADHFTGKTHQGYKSIREKLAELEKANVQPIFGRDRGGGGRSEAPRAQFPVQFPVSSRVPDTTSSSSSSSSASSSSSSSSSSTSNGKSRDRSRERDRSRDRRDRDRDRDRERDRERDRDRDRRDRDRDRDRRDRDRDRDRDRRRDRSRDRSRSDRDKRRSRSRSRSKGR